MFKIQKIRSLRFKNTFNLKLSVCHLSTCQRVRSFEEVPQIPKKHFIQRFWKILKTFDGREQTNSKYERDDYFNVLYKRYGKIVSDPNTNSVHLFDPKDVEILFKNETRLPFKNLIDAMVVARARNKDASPKHSTLLDNGNEWYNLRKKMSNYLFNPQIIQGICPAFDSVALDFVNNILANKNQKNDRVEFLYEELCKWSFENTGLLIFGKRLGSLNLNQNEAGSDSIRFVKALDSLLTTSYTLHLGFPWYKWFSTPMYKNVERSYTTISKIVFKYIHQNIAEDHTKAKSGTRSGLLVNLFSQKLKNDEDIASIVADLLIGGTDTTAGLTAMVLYHLAKNPIQQQKLYNEIQIFFKNPGDVISIDQLQPLTYIKACIKETHRLTPITDTVIRFLDKDHVFSGYKIPSGSRVIIHHRLMGKIYFENSNAFEPERWLDGKDTHHPFSWLPFGHGVRGCVGRKVAQVEMLLLVIRVLQKYKLSYDGDDRVTTTSTFVNKPNKEIKIKFINR